ncbi:hypothetical protein ACH5RR_014524 [Cinchona calisaya]|uniref:At1g61320/AtMIF1 LRR domain-containing protein n=1 Tax=Cinchona calisaya TaxID=153742 RepID=A0ABD3A353_9GENT
MFFVMLTIACPFLSIFLVTFLYTERVPKQEMVSHLLSHKRAEADLRAHHHHQCLKVVKLINFACYKTDFRFALAILQIAKSLEKIIISPGPGYFGTVRILTIRERSKQAAYGAKLVIL